MSKGGLSQSGDSEGGGNLSGAKREKLGEGRKKKGSMRHRQRMPAPSSCLSRPAGTPVLQANCADAFVWRKMRQLNGGQRPWEQLCPL